MIYDDFVLNDVQFFDVFEVVWCEWVLVMVYVEGYDVICYLICCLEFEGCIVFYYYVQVYVQIVECEVMYCVISYVQLIDMLIVIVYVLGCDLMEQI